MVMKCVVEGSFYHCQECTICLRGAEAKGLMGSTEKPG